MYTVGITSQMGKNPEQANLPIFVTIVSYVKYTRINSRGGFEFGQ